MRKNVECTFNLKDPQEMRNVYNDPAYVDVQKDLHAQLEELRTKYGDSDELNQKFIDMPIKK